VPEAFGRNIFGEWIDFFNGKLRGLHLGGAQHLIDLANRPTISAPVHGVACLWRRSLLSTALLLPLPFSAVAAEAARRSFQIAAGDAAETLKQFASQANREILFPVEPVAGIRTHAIKGTFTPRDGLERMVRGTGLTIVEDAKTGALMITRPAEPKRPGAPSSPNQETSRTMKSRNPLAVLGGILAGALVPFQADAQSTPPASRAAQPTPAETIQLSAFEVKEDSDTSYGALQSNALTAFSLDLAKTPVTAQVFTQAFMDDIAATNIEEILINYHGAISGATHNSTDAITQEPGDRSGGSGLAIRGINTAEIARDGFIGPPPSVRSSTGLTTNYQTERIEVLEGPQSILYGASSGGGVVNTMSKRATFNRHRGSVRLVADTYGSLQGLLDYNLGLNRFAVRVAATAAENRTVRKKIGNDLTGLYTQIAFQVHPTTVVRLQTEKTDAMARVSFKPNLNPFLATNDPRRNVDSRTLALTGQLVGLPVLDRELDYYNLDGLGSWWSSERIDTQFSALTVESSFRGGFSLQLRAIYNETVDTRATDGRTLLPAAGRPNSAANPYPVTAMRIGSPVQINEQRDRNRGVRLAFAHDGELNLGGNRGRSQTAFGAHGHKRGPRFASSGIAKAYYRADSNWNPIVNPNVALDYGRERLEFAYFPVQGGVPKKPLFEPGSERVTLNGVNYVLQPRILTDPAYVTPGNPYGMIPNNPTAANPNQFSGNWHRGAFSESVTIFVANFSEWRDGRLSTLLGYSLTQFEAISVQPGQNIGVTPRAWSPGWQAGVNYAFRPWLRAYAGIGASEQPENSTLSLFGETLKHQSAEGLAPEVGLKMTSMDGRYSAQLNYNFETKAYNERRNTSSVNALDTVNPNGVNGRHGPGAQNRANVDRSLTAASLTLTADPTRNWRMRFSLSYLDGEILTTVREAVVYNDQFHTRGSNVTYADGTNVLVDPAGGNNRNTPLTLTMINDPSSRFYANPDPSSGRITNTNLRNALMLVDPVRGMAATGVTGLPLSSVQYNYTSPYPDGIYTIYQAGDKNTGFNQYSVNFQNKYTFSEGILKGVGVFGDVRTYYKNRSYYMTHPGGARELFSLPRSTTFNLGVSYSRRIGQRYTWTTQVNVRNLFNHYKVWLLPSASNSQEAIARLSEQPRAYIWTNTFSF
jgi:outer membrane receptor protein involved in Fe transport